MVCGAGVEASEVVEASVEVEGWSARPWVRLRPLTEAEALERESLGLVEQYELVDGGLAEPEVRVTRTYDLRAMAEYDWAHCVVDGCLPEMVGDGTVAQRRLGRGGTGSGGPDGADAGGAHLVAEAVELLGRMQPALAAWLAREIERVNRRLPEQQAELEAVKKS